MSLALIVLAAGKGTRMQSDLPKVLHQIAGAPMLHHALRTGGTLSPDRTVVVAGHEAEAVSHAARAFDDTAQVVLQPEQLGTAHAVAQAAPALDGHEGDALVLYGDTPFISPETLARMAEARQSHDIVILGFEATDPGRYGRLVMNCDTLEKIVEFKDAGVRERAITFCNSGVVMAATETLMSLVDAVGNDNASGEYYLTDIVEVARARGLSATAIACDEAETLGVNSRADLAVAEEVFQSAMRRAAMETGVTLTAPGTVFFAFDTVIGRDTIVEPHVVFGPGVSVETGAHIRAFSHLEGCHVSRGAVVGPYARLRPGTELAEDVRIGNFVEIKNATLDEGAKVNHLSYIGDASVGAAANIGAGTVTCNYDGVMKHRTEIGPRAFIGSDTMLVAPVRVGAGAMTASGSVITRDVAEDALAIGRARQVEKPGLARKMFEILKMKKRKRDGGEA
ncbi:bifunctional UDP-N-acetylglucosamine diphosphorylase/glucosamine-1-phosphate N-acetyltransferase GlmU [Roseovarius sp. SCSIO 43702]|uniref:bifunctional UDP-N-acetylglucosamine diphosphorylase/glucosamine-1-phosphate N-acetyltransferase GlmU n=1 Tax=Roseovarius sp. SCSIO 43702 TaxID=2823043 RepID=UPI001C7385DC|nr:bifunctional UDP-N-acetylglucosamine diphosphorylase/glucosamine-1-phosphate N-acetyltransferase GlmU [Roseovarius sp. SCSIO 43702]QYX55646.1 bifunctional UDP-N-acetylglucosamine diphosphorylase/glucosamine-1-phosphate N-acetyltransferase GlmU [Roseovarius sp. SCSIO 43702]